MRRLRPASTRRLTAIVAATVALVLDRRDGAGRADGLRLGPGPEAARQTRSSMHSTRPSQRASPRGSTSRTTCCASGSLRGHGASPLLAGADGRLWITKDGRFRLELQSDAGDAQIVSDGKLVTRLRQHVEHRLPGEAAR